MEPPAPLAKHIVKSRFRTILERGSDVKMAHFRPFWIIASPIGGFVTIGGGSAMRPVVGWGWESDAKPRFGIEKFDKTRRERGGLDLDETCWSFEVETRKRRVSRLY